MKMIKMALLGGAALAVTAVAAQADDLTALKAQIESLNARMAAMEAAPAVPAGYSLLTVSDGQATVVPGMTREEQASFSGPATIISVLPTADAPAGATIDWNGYARANLRYTDFNGPAGTDFNTVDIRARGRLNVTAKTDTAVGEVGVRLRVEGNGDGPADLFVKMPVAWGYWQMTPELALGGGYSGSLGNIGFGYDGACTCAIVDNADVYANNGRGGTSDTSQMRLSYSSGPLGFGLALEDATVGPDKMGAAGEITYAGDTISGEISGMYRDTTNDANWQAGLGLGFNLDPVSLSMAAGLGNDGFGADFWYVNGLASVGLSDQMHAELGLGYKAYDFGGGPDEEHMGISGGVYYTPVSQLTIGLEAEYEKINNNANFGGADTDQVWAGLTTVYSF